MGKKDIAKQKLLTEALSFRADSATPATYGNVNGYPVIAVAGGSNIDMAHERYWSLIFCVKPYINDNRQASFSDLQKSSKAIKAVNYRENRLWVSVKYASKDDQNKENLREALQLTIAFLKENGYQSICSLSGRTDDLVCCVLAGSYIIANREELSKRAGDVLSHTEKESALKENVPVGALGALLGSLVGAASIILIGLLGYVSSVSGMIMGIATIALYRKFAGKISWKGFIVSGVSIAAMTYLAHRLRLAVMIAEDLELTLGKAFSLVPIALESSFYYGELFKLFLFVLLGSAVAFTGYVKGRKKEKVIHIMG